MKSIALRWVPLLAVLFLQPLPATAEEAAKTSSRAGFDRNHELVIETETPAGSRRLSLLLATSSFHTDLGDFAFAGRLSSAAGGAMLLEYEVRVNHHVETEAGARHSIRRVWEGGTLLAPGQTATVIAGDELTLRATVRPAVAGT